MNIFNISYGAQNITSIVDQEAQSWILDNLVNPIFSLILAIAVSIFFYGTARFILNRNNPEQNNAGKKSMFWGIVGIFIIASVWQIMDMVAASLESKVRLGSSSPVATNIITI